MVCPKCGRDCGNDAFCGGCGTKLEAAQPRNTGRLCPHCGGTEAIGNICAYCGLEIERTVHPEADSYVLPVGSYTYDGDTIQLGEDHLSFTVHRGLFRYGTARLRYDQLTHVHYLLPENVFWGKRGYLVFRWEENHYVPIPFEGNYSKDLCALKIGSFNSELAYQIFWFLRMRKPTAQFASSYPQYNRKGLTEYSEERELDAYFERFNPFRKKAAQALADAKAIPYEIARNIIDRGFTARQQHLYGCDPSLTVRDLNRAVRDFREREAAEKRNAERKTVPEDFDD